MNPIINIQQDEDATSSSVASSGTPSLPSTVGVSELFESDEERGDRWWVMPNRGPLHVSSQPASITNESEDSASISDLRMSSEDGDIPEATTRPGTTVNEGPQSVSSTTVDPRVEIEVDLDDNIPE